MPGSLRSFPCAVGGVDERIVLLSPVEMKLLLARCPVRAIIDDLESSKTTLDIFTMMNGDNDLPLCMSFFAITEGFSYVA